MQSLHNFLLQFGNFNPQQLELVNQSVKVRTLKREEYFLEAGKIPNEVAFLNEGILRVCYYDRQGEEITKYFIAENNFVVDLSSFLNQVPSSEYIQATTAVELIVFSRDSLENLSNTILIWDAVMNKIINKALIEKVNRISPMLGEDAKTRYLNFHNRFPNLVNRIPLNYLASYIGITKHSLSRIRREISQSK